MIGNKRVHVLNLRAKSVWVDALRPAALGRQCEVPGLHAGNADRRGLDFMDLAVVHPLRRLERYARRSCPKYATSPSVTVHGTPKQPDSMASAQTTGACRAVPPLNVLGPLPPHTRRRTERGLPGAQRNVAAQAVEGAIDQHRVQLMANASGDVDGGVAL